MNIKRLTFDNIKSWAAMNGVKIERRKNSGYDVWMNDDSIAECASLKECVEEIYDLMDMHKNNSDVNYIISIEE